MTNIRTKQIKGKLDILLVDGLPEQIRKDIHLINWETADPLLDSIRSVLFLGTEIKGNWKYLSTIEGLSEEQADELVGEMLEHVTLQGKFYVDYTNEEMMFATAIESFHSLLSANDVITDRDNCPNRFCVDGKIDMGYGVFLTCSICEDDNIFSPSTTLIFVKE